MGIEGVKHRIKRALPHNSVVIQNHKPSAARMGGSRVDIADKTEIRFVSNDAYTAYLR